MDMLISILVGLTALTLLSLGSAALVYGYLTGRLRKPVTIGAIATSIVLGAALLARPIADGETFAQLAFPIGVFFLLAGAIAGIIVLRFDPTSPARR
jgi:hypothetical protein